MYRIGVDLGGTNIAVGLVDESMSLLKKKSTPTGGDRDGELIVDDIAALCKSICEENNVALSDIVCIGIGVPGIALNETGMTDCPNIRAFKNFPLVKLLKERIDVENIKLCNDANAAAWGEAVAGAAKGSSNNIMVTLGTGVGGGIIIDNKIYSGFNGAAGELGHIVLDMDGVQCGCGRKGCWEAYSSATALIRMTNEKIEECRAAGRDSLMLKAEKVNGRTACDAMRAGDAAAKEVYDKYIKYLASGLTNIINIFQPEIISLGGGISNEGQSLIDALLPIIRSEEYGRDSIPHTEIRIAKLGNDAGIIGAAMLG